MRLISLNCILLSTLLLSCDTASNIEPIYEEYFTKYYGDDGEQQGVEPRPGNRLGDDLFHRPDISDRLIRIEGADFLLHSRSKTRRIS